TAASPSSCTSSSERPTRPSRIESGHLIMLRPFRPLFAAETAGASEQPAETTASAELPPDALIILPVRNLVWFPGVVAPVVIGRPASIAAAQEAVRQGRPIGVLMQRDAEEAEA